jgi:hypothetical protein
MNTWFGDKVDKDKLTVGVASESTWLTTMTILRLLKAWIQHYVTKGTHNWDVVIHQLFLVVLVSSYGSRSSDVA